MKRQKLKFKIIFLAILFLAFFGMAKNSEAVYPVAGRRKFLLAGFLFAFFILFSDFSFALPAYGANWYVRPSGGSGAGTSWTNAWNGMQSINFSSVACGDTVWIAGGTYAGALNINKVCSSGSKLYIRRARSDAAECTGAAGWSSGYDATIVQTPSGRGSAIIVGNGSASYVTVSGRTAASGGSYGWFLDYRSSGGNGDDAISLDAASGKTLTNNLFEYIEMQGPGVVVYSGGQRGIDLTPAAACSDNTFSHLAIHGFANGVYDCECDNTTWDHNEIYDIMDVNWDCGQYSPCFHPATMYLCGGDSGKIIRYSKYGGHSGNTGDGIFVSTGGDGWQIYGNIFYDISNQKGMNFSSSATSTNLKIFNNTFVNVPSYALTYQPGSCSGCESKNNLSYNASPDSPGSASNNLTTTAAAFRNYAARDFHLASNTGGSYPRNAGAALAAEYGADMDGVARGEGGAWDVGAYEYSDGGGGETTPPASPTGLTVN